MGIIAGLLSMTFWGTAIFLAALASRRLGNVLTLFWMQLFGFLVGSFFFLINFGSFTFTAVTRNIPLLIVVAILQAIAYLAFYKGLEKAQVSLVSPIGATWGLITAVLGVIFFKELLSITQLLAIGLIVTGIVLLSINIQELVSLKKVNLLVGVKEGVIAMLGWGISLFLLVSATKDLGWFLPAFIFRFFVLLLMTGFIVFSKKTFVPISTKLPTLLLLLIGVFDIGGFFSYSIGVAGSNSSIVAPISSAFALVTVLLARIFLKEKLEVNKIVGISAIVVGLILISS